MMHSNLTRWIEDADAREVFLQLETIHESQRVSRNQYIHLGQTIKKVFFVVAPQQRRAQALQ